MLDLIRTSKKWTRLETSRVAVLSSVFVYSSATFANPVDRNQSIVSTTKHWSNLHKYFRFHSLMQMLLTGFLINGWPKPMGKAIVLQGTPPALPAPQSMHSSRVIDWGNINRTRSFIAKFVRNLCARNHRWSRRVHICEHLLSHRV